ncbi:MAG: MarR family transcriptional regulator [Bacteroidales bacterium]|nr:MarR family transcriptional regulator [Lentimicrobiaceae bacterium]MBQ3593785.1 MarR family transcriptional regulator [Bacteroidales bacterium]MBR3914260.1 MarR family transcriptional regulator [Bacteroidales bacterium]
MLLIKKIAVDINILNCSLIKIFSKELSKNNINLTPEQYLVMDILWDQGTLSQQAIADIIQKDKNSVTKFIDSLEKKGLVSRVVNKNDRRINNIIVSEEGLKLKDKTTEVAINMMQNVLADISEDDLLIFDKVMNQIKSNIDSY